MDRAGISPENRAGTARPQNPPPDGDSLAVIEEPLSRSEIELADFFENASIGLHWVGPDGTVLRVNRAELDLLGYARDEYVGRSICDFHVDQEVIADILRRLTAGEVLRNFEARMRCKDGSIKYVLIDSSVMWENGQFIHTRCFTRDITEQKAIEAALRESEERFRTTVNQAAVGVAHVDMDNRTIWVNPGMCSMLGYTESELKELSFLDVTHPEDIDLDLGHAQSLIAGQIPSYRIEKRYLHKNGSVIWGDLAVSLMRDATGQPQYAVGVVVDITERKNAEERLAAVLASINDHLVCYDRQWRYTFVNDKAAQVLGKKKSELLGHSIWDLFPDAIGNQYYQELHQALAEQCVVRSVHYYAPFETWFENHIYPTPDGVTVFSADVTWRKKLEHELQQRAEQLAEADRRKDEFLATLAHELRNPLAPIRNGLEVMKLASPDSAAVAEARSMMERQLAQMVRLVDDLLDVSRITRNKLELRKERVELASIIHSAIETSRPVIEHAGHTFSVTLPSLPVHLEGDAVRLAQVFSNLLNNSAKYTERGGKIELIAEVQDEQVCVRVKDNGLGIPASALPRLFQMFSQVEHHFERAQGGLGIGLTLVRRLVEMHGGSVEAHSDGPGCGSEFSVCLPIVLKDILDGSVPPPAAQGAATTPNRRVLVVDDNRDSAISLGMMLKLMGNEIRLAEDGPTAIQAAEEFQPDLILLDIGLPKMNGYQVCRRIRENRLCNGVVIVALTGWGQDEDRRRSLDAGFDDHLVKPVDLSELNRLLGQRKEVSS